MEHDHGMCIGDGSDDCGVQPVDNRPTGSILLVHDLLVLQPSIPQLHRHLPNRFCNEGSCLLVDARVKAGKVDNK